MIELKSLGAEDEEIVLNWRNNPEIARFMYTDHVISQDEHRSWLRNALTDEAQRHWIIHYDAAPVGLVSVTNLDARHSSAQWAFYLASPNVRGKGVGSAVDYLILEFVFEELGLHRLSCAVLAFNEQVIAMHESFGFRREGQLRGAIRKGEEWIDVILLSQLREEWALHRLQHRDRLSERGLIAS
jgi:UDP-4-amino-4,6-dideoxy-N-acetyl-beta-L-altrosamine N-acetyltransferase